MAPLLNWKGVADMSSKMLKFVSTEKAMPEKRKAEKRVADFDEIYDDFDAAEAETQSSRCSQCGVPFCQVNCPLHNLSLIHI